MTDADKVDLMNPHHLGRYPADIRTRVRINTEIRIQTPDHFGGGLRSLSTV